MVDETRFAVEIGFEKETHDPARVFKAMADLIAALQATDRTLIKTLNVRLVPTLVLDDVEIGSLRTWLRNELVELEDDSLKSGDYKKVIGLYLVRAKHAIIRRLDKKTEISVTDLDELDAQLVEIAEDTDIMMLPAFRPPSRSELVSDIRQINDALQPLNGDEDRAKFISNEGEVSFNLDLDVDSDAIDASITAEMIQSSSTVIMKIKKPDLLGSSQWDFHYDGHTIPATVADSDWLSEFQAGRMAIVPGDAIRATLLSEVTYDADGDVVAKHYTITRVLSVIHSDAPEQPPLF